MTKGVIYIMKTAVAGLIKIGKANIKNFTERMRNLEFNGYYNVIGLKRFFAIDNQFSAKVVGEREVEFEGEIWELSPLVREIQTRRGKVNKSGVYQSAQYFIYRGIKLADLKEVYAAK